MLPIPAFNPGDTVAYPNGNGVINVGAADAGSKMLLYNESPFNLNIDFLNGSQSILHAWEARYWTLDGDTRQVEWNINSTLNVTSSPISLVIGELYGPTDKLEGTYPMGLIRQTNVGNPGGVATTSSTGITNDNNNAGTPIMESTVAGLVGSSVSLTNDAVFKLLVVIAGALVQVLKTNNVDPLVQIGAATYLAEVLGNLKIDGTLTVSGMTTFNKEFAAGDNPSNTTTFKLKALSDTETALRIQQHSATQSANLITLLNSAGTTTLASFDASGNLTAPGANVLGAAAVLTHILGTLTVDGASTFTGEITASSDLKTNTIRDNVNGNTAIDLSAGDGGVKIPANKLVSSLGQLLLDGTGGNDLFLNPTNSGVGHKVSFVTNAIERANVQDDGVHLVNSPIRYVSGRVARFDKANFTAAAGTYPTTKTYTHSLGYTPDFIWIMPGQAVASFGSCTIGVWNWGATTFDVTLGAQINFQAFFIKLDP